MPENLHAKALHAAQTNVYQAGFLEPPPAWEAMNEGQRAAYAQLAAAVLTVPLTVEQSDCCHWFRAGRAYRAEHGPNVEGPPLEHSGAAHLPAPWRSWADHQWACGWTAEESAIDLTAARKAFDRSQAELREVRREKGRAVEQCEKAQAELVIMAHLSGATVDAADLKRAEGVVRAHTERAAATATEAVSK